MGVAQRVEGRRRDLVRDGLQAGPLDCPRHHPAAYVAVVVGCARSGYEHEVVRTTGQLVLAQLGDERRCDLDDAPGPLGLQWDAGAMAVKLVAEGDRLRVEIDLAPDDAQRLGQ